MAPLAPSGSASSDYFEPEDPAWIEALHATVLPGDDPGAPRDKGPKESAPERDTMKRKRSPETDGERVGDDNQGNGDGPAVYDEDTYGASKFGGFGDYMRRKRAKLQIQNAHIDGAGESTIFRGLAIYINGLTEPSVQDLRALIIKHGGVYHAYLDRKALVTHIITCALTPAKIKEFKHMKVVRPEWLTRSASLGTLLPWSDFIFRSGHRADSIQGTKVAQRSLLDGFGAVSSSSPRMGLPFSSQNEEGAEGAGEEGDDKEEMDLEVNMEREPESTPPTPPPAQRRTPFLSPSQAEPQPQRLEPAEPTSNLPDPDPIKLTTSTTTRPAYASHTSNPYARRAMTDPSWRSAHTSVAPDFIEGYYKNSRLHHLATWKAELKGLVAEACERAEAGGVGGERADGSGAERGVVVGEVPAVGGVSMRGAELVMRSHSGDKSKGKQRATDSDLEIQGNERGRVIMHLDFDAFFVSAGLVSRPQLRGKAVVVCHSQGAQGAGASTSEIASASYEAREHGIKNGMSLQQARKLCPTILTIPYEFERYKQFSLLFYTILMTHADDLEAVSVDEALVDVTSSVARYAADYPEAADAAKEFAETIRIEIKKATGCEVSIGIAHNIMLARLATRRAKPAGSYHLIPAGVVAFIAPLQIDGIWGFGSSTAKKVEEKLGTRTLGELVGKSKAVLCDALGKGTGEKLFNAIRGIDEQRLQSDKPRKSVSCEINYGIRFENNEQAEVFVYQMAEEVSRRLVAADVRGRSLALKIMKRDPDSPVEPPKFLGHGACDTFNKQIMLAAPGGRPTCDEKIIGEHAWRLLKSFNFDPKELRGIGIQIQKLGGASAAAATAVNPEAGQGQLPFKPVGSPSKPRHMNHPQVVVQPPSDDVLIGMVDEQPVAGPSRLPQGYGEELPSLSQVDQDVFAALPDDVQRELEAEYKRRSRSPVPFLSKRPSEPRELFSKITVKGTNVKRITQQLAPKNRSIVSPKKHNIFRRSGVKITDEELIALDIDPEVFALIPEEMHREQLALARDAKRMGGIAAVVKGAQGHKRKEIKASQRRSTSAVYRRRPAPMANFPEPVKLRRPGARKSELLVFTETDDIQDVIQNWVYAFRLHPPNQKDVNFFAKFIVQSADSSRSTDAGMEKSVAVMKWWLMLLRRCWGPWEHVHSESAANMVQTEVVGRAWWTAFRLVKEQVDLVARKKFGGSVSLK